MKQQPIKEKVGNIEVKIYRCQRPDGYANFQVADYSMGRRRLLTFADEDKARSEAKRIAGAISRGEVIAARLTPEQCASYGRAVELLKGTGVSLEIAAAHFAESVRILKGDRVIEASKYFDKKNPSNLPPKPVSEVIAELIASKKAKGKGARYIKDLEYRLSSKFAEAFPCNLSSIAGAQVQTFLDGLKLSPRSYLNFRRVIGTLFKFAKRKGYLPRDWDELEQIEGITDHGGEVTIFTPAEMKRLLQAADKRFQPCLAIGAFIGLRSAEIERLQWRDIDLEQGLITVQRGNSKTRSRRTVPIPENLALWLKPRMKASGPVWPGSHDDYYDAQQETAIATKTKEKKAVEWKQNALRHSFISYRLALTKDENEVALEAGNSPTMIHQHYKGISGVTEKSAREWFSIKPAAAPANVITISEARAA